MADIESLRKNIREAADEAGRYSRSLRSLYMEARDALLSEEDQLLADAGELEKLIEVGLATEEDHEDYYRLLHRIQAVRQDYEEYGRAVAKLELIEEPATSVGSVEIHGERVVPE